VFSLLFFATEVPIRAGFLNHWLADTLRQYPESRPLAVHGVYRYSTYKLAII
jgi:hypothetical protein